MAGFCSFSAILGGKCESSRGHTDCIALNDCDGDISLHLANHHLSRENSSERDLILARAGLLELTEEQIKNTMVCPAHRFTLGKYWQAPKTCQYPRHHKKKSAVTGTHVINFKLAREIKNLFGEAAPVGSLCSIIENTLEALKKEHPHITQVNFRSDEAGCYYNNFLLAAVRDAGNRVGITVTRYDFYEPQYGKDVCDRILCPMKSAIRRYCNEGHDVLSAKDMRTALSERPVRGTTASVCSVNESQKTLEVKMTDHFSRYHNFLCESNGIRIWRAYNVGQGRLIPYQDIIVKPQGPTDLVIDVDFFPVKEARIHDATSTDGEETSGLFSCPEPGCQMVFKKVSELENHLDVGEHRQMRGGSETVYDKLRRDWAEKFLNVDNNEGRSSAPVAHCDERGDEFEYQAPSFCSDLQLGWALHKRTGNKADPGKVAADMRTARRPDGLRIFDRLNHKAAQSKLFQVAANLIHTIQFWFISALLCSSTVFITEVNGAVGVCGIDPKEHEAFCKLEDKLDRITAYMEGVPGASSCREVYNQSYCKVNKAYPLRVGFAKIPVYCHLTQLGACGEGGWTLVMKIDGTKKTFHYDSKLWSDQETFNILGGLTGLDLQETKLPTYWNTPFTKICLGMKIGQQINFMAINKSDNSLYSLIADGQYRATALGRNTWKTLIGSQASLQLHCNKEGFNAIGDEEDQSKARIGIIANNQNDCTTCDSRIGFGTGGLHDDSNTCGNEATLSPDHGDVHIKAMGYIFVQ
ncbi:hypothetical protein ACROYT_G018005 [Oculina patagonica]